MPNPADPKAIDISPEAVAQVSASLRKSRDSIHFDCGGDCDGERRAAADLLEALNAKLAETIRDRDYARDACAGMVDAANGLGRELKETRSKFAEAERERDGANLAFQASMQRTAYLEKTKLNFVEALEACKRGLEAWRDEPHNAKWWRRIDGTPIPNDLLSNIAEIIAQTANADRAERDAALSELAKLRAEAEWRPIETVPSGEEIFMAATAHGRIMIVRGSILATMMKRSTPDHLQFPAVAWKPLPSLPKDPAHD